jgi:hypothetical protein
MSLAEHAPDAQSKMVLEEMATRWAELAALVEKLEVAGKSPPLPMP